MSTLASGGHFLFTFKRTTFWFNLLNALVASTSRTASLLANWDWGSGTSHSGQSDSCHLWRWHSRGSRGTAGLCLAASWLWSSCPCSENDIRGSLTPGHLFKATNLQAAKAVKPHGSMYEEQICLHRQARASQSSEEGYWNVSTSRCHELSEFLYYCFIRASGGPPSCLEMRPSAALFPPSLVSQMSVQVVVQTLGSGGNLAIAVGLCDLTVICPNHLQSRGSCGGLDLLSMLFCLQRPVWFL